MSREVSNLHSPSFPTDPIPESHPQLSIADWLPVVASPHSLPLIPKKLRRSVLKTHLFYLLCALSDILSTSRSLCVSSKNMEQTFYPETPVATSQDPRRISHQATHSYHTLKNLRGGQKPKKKNTNPTKIRQGICTTITSFTKPDA